MHATETHLSRERFHPRVDAGFMVKLLAGGRPLIAKAENLSMNGLYVQCSALANVGRCTVVLPLPNDREVVCGCIVRRLDGDGIALEFDGLDWDDMFALARFLHPRLP